MRSETEMLPTMLKKSYRRLANHHPRDIHELISDQETFRNGEFTTVDDRIYVYNVPDTYTPKRGYRKSRTREPTP